jgi:ATP-binding cassette subfamily B protein
MSSTDEGLLRQLWRFRPYAGPHRSALAFGMALRIGELFTDLAKPWPLAFVVDDVLNTSGPHGIAVRIMHYIPGGTVGLINFAAVSLLVLTVISGLLDYVGDRIMNSAGERITASIRADTFGRLQRLPVSYHDQQAVGELTSRVSSDTNRIEDSLVDLFSTLVPGIVSIIAFAAALVIANWRLGIIALGTAPLVFVTASRYTRLTRQSAKTRRAAEGKMAALVTESLNGIRTIHAFGRYRLHDQRFATNNTATLDAGLRAVELRARFTPLLEAVTAIGTAVLLWVGALGALRHLWTVGLLIVVMAYLRDMLKPMRSLSQLSMTFAQGAASAERIAAILDEEPAPAGHAWPAHARAAGRIDFHRVSFNYGRGTVLHNLNLTIEPGERVAVIGASGAGKSTVLSLISGMQQPTRGRVHIDGIPLVDLSEQWRHSQISIVLQDTFLFSGTIADNIRYARPNATDAEIGRAAHAALVTEFTRELREGLNTTIADNGTGLSGGQRQRIGIARALLANSPIVLLDEPTAGLDEATEHLVIQALAALVGHRTVVMTTHRPALLSLATRVIHIHRGVLQHTEFVGPGVYRSAGVRAGHPGA